MHKAPHRRYILSVCVTRSTALPKISKNCNSEFKAGLPLQGERGGKC